MSSDRYRLYCNRLIIKKESDNCAADPLVNYNKIERYGFDVV